LEREAGKYIGSTIAREMLVMFGAACTIRDPKSVNPASKYTPD
jgi:hypothetical protein